MKWIKGFICLVGCVVVFALATSLTIRFLLRDDSTVACPNLAGLDIDEAKQAAGRRGLSVLVAKYERRRDIPYNRVLVQKPDAETPVRAGRAVSVILSDGPRPQPIPDVVGLTLDEATRGIQQMTIQVKKVIYVPGGAMGQVLAQIPSGGPNVLSDDGMTLVVGGQEKRFFLMPDIQAKDVAAAAQEMEEKGIKYVYGPAQPEPVKGAAPKNRVLPKTIFGDDAVIELPASTNVGG